MNPSGRDYVAGVISSTSQLGMPLPAGSPSARQHDPNYESPMSKTAAADKLAFQTLAKYHEALEGPRVEVDGKSHLLIDDVGGGRWAVSLGLSSLLKKAWSDNGIDPVDQFADELSDYQKAAKNIRSEYDSDYTQKKKQMKNWVEAKKLSDH